MLRRSPSAHFILLGALLLAGQVVFATVSAALFVKREGADQIPWVYLLLAVASVAMVVSLSGVIDRRSKTGLLIAFLFSVILLLLSAQLFLWLDLPSIYYILYAYVHVADIMGDLLFWMILFDYLGPLQLKRATASIVIGCALGGITGSAATAAAAALWDVDQLLALPILFFGAAIVHTYWIRGNLDVVGSGGFDDDDDAEPSGGLLDAIRLLPGLCWRHRLVLWLSSTAFLMIVICCFSEYLYLSIYAAHFATEESLTLFLVVMSVVTQVAEFALLLAATQKILEHLGPILRNLLFPVSSFATLAALWLHLGLPSAILAQINRSAIANAVYEPVQNINYAALPPGSLGRARLVVDGLFYPLGMALSGILLLGLQLLLGIDGVALVATALAAIFLVVGAMAGRSFLPTLFRSLRGGAIELDRVARSELRSAPWFAAEIRELLNHRRAESRGVAIELLPQVDAALVLDGLRHLAGSDAAVERRACALALARSTSPDVSEFLSEALASESARVQETALYALLARGEGLDPDRHGALSGSDAAAVRTLAALAGPPAAEQIARAVELTDPEVRDTVALAMAQARRTDLLSPLGDLLPAVTTPARIEATAALCAWVEPGHPVAPEIARLAIDDPDPQLRTHGFRLLGVVDGAAASGDLRSGLRDPSPLARQAAVEALADLGDHAVGVATEHLQAGDPTLRKSAILVLGKVGSASARRALLDDLTADFAQAHDNAALLRRYRALLDHEPCFGLWVAIEDSSLRIFDRVLLALDSLRRDRVADEIRLGIVASDQRRRESAAELLAALPERRLTAPILPLVSLLVTDAPRRPPHTDLCTFLTKAAASRERWIRLAARTALDEVPALDDDPFWSTDMSRILFLKNLSIFREMPLDHILALHNAMQVVEVLGGETVFHEGARGRELYIIMSGRLDVTKGDTLLAELAAGDYFGEMALIDDAPRSASVVAKEDARLLRLSGFAFRRLAAEHPEILMELCRLFVGRLRNAQAHLSTTA